MSRLALFGGPRAVTCQQGDLFQWPIVNPEMEQGVLGVLRAGNMSGTDLARRFEQSWAEWHGVKHALGVSTGTGALHCAMYGLGIGPGDEIICPSITYWASCLPVFSLGGTVVFADIDPETLCLDPDDFARRIGPRTRAVVVVHYAGHPADMDRIMPVARRHGVAVIEDFSHAQGGRYRGKQVGTFGEVGASSLMSGKSFAIGEAGIMVTSEREIYERALAFAFYERHGELTEPGLRAAAGLPWGGYKYRLHQMSAAVGLAQLKKYPAEMAEIDQAMNYFWDLLEGVPGVRSNRGRLAPGSNMAGWYAARALYDSAALGGLSLTRFCEALRAEGIAQAQPGCNKALHLHPLLREVDVYCQGQPTRRANATREVREEPGDLPVAEGIQRRVFAVPVFKRFYPWIIEEYAAAVRKVVEAHRELLAEDPGDPETGGSWGLTIRTGSA